MSQARTGDGSIPEGEEGPPIDPQKLQRFSKFQSVLKSFTTLAYGHAGKPKVLYYDLGALVSKGAFHTVFQTKASIFTMDASLAKSQMLYMLWFLVMGSLSYFFMPEEHLRGMQELEKFTNYWNVFIPFILGLFISLNIGRWWTLRCEGLGMVLDAAQNVVLLMNGTFHGPSWEELHDQVLKYALASISLIVNACRGNEDVESLGPKGDNLFTAEEMEVVDSVPYRARPVLMWTWILMLLSKVCDENDVNTGKFRDMTCECKKARNAISIIWSYLRTQLPFAYVHLVTFMVNLNNFFVAVKCGILFALAVKQNEHSRALNQFFFVCIVPPLYQALLTISYVIHDPFGEDLLDFPIMAFQEYCNEAAVSMSSMGFKCPALSKSQLWMCAAKLKKDEPSSKDGAPKPGDDMPMQAIGASFAVEKDAVTEEVKKDVLTKFEDSVTRQLEAKDEVINMLRDRAKALESSLSGMSGRLEMLEGRLAASSTIAPPAGGWCSNLQRVEPAGRPVAFNPNAAASSAFSKNST